MWCTVLSIWICCLGVTLVSTLGSDNQDMAQIVNNGHQPNMIRRMQRSYSNPWNYNGKKQKDSHSEECASGCSRETLRKIVKSSSVATEVTIFTVSDAAPFISQSDYGRPTGFDVDLINCIADLLQIKFKYVYKQFAELVSAVQSNRNTISISFQADSVAREQFVNFADYFRYATGFIVRSDYTGTINGLGDLCGKKVIALINSTTQTAVQQQNTICGAANQIIFQGASNVTDIIEAVKSGSADVGSANAPVLAYSASHSNGQLKIVGSVFNPATVGILCNKGDQALCCLLVDAINYLIRDGTYGQLLSKYSFTYETNGVCPSRLNLNGTTCLSACVPDNSFCQTKLS